MLAVLAVRDGADTAAGVRAVLAALSERPGFVGGHAARGLEEPHDWVVVSHWAGVGDFRRALGSMEVKLATGPLHALMLDAVPAGGYAVAETA